MTFSSLCPVLTCRNLALACGLALFATALSGQTDTWLGGTSGAWTDGTNWSTGSAPVSASTDAVLSGGGATTITGVSGAIGNVTISGADYNLTGGLAAGKNAVLSIQSGTQTFNNFTVTSSGFNHITVAAGATFKATGTFSAGRLFLGGAGNYDFEAGISSAIPINVSGTPTITFAGNDTYTGQLTMSAGTIYFNGSVSDANMNDVISGGTVGGTGSIGRGLLFKTGALLAPGVAGPGVLTIGRALTLNSDATTAFDINGTTRGTSYDGLNIGGLTTYGGALALNFGTLLDSGSTLNLFQLTGGVASNSFNVVTAAGDYSGSFTNSGGVWTLLSAGQTLTFDQSSGALTVAAAAIPEPATCTLLTGLAALCAVAWHRRASRRGLRV